MKMFTKNTTEEMHCALEAPASLHNQCPKNRSGKPNILITLTMAVLGLFAVSTGANGQAVSLGGAQNFTIVGASTITNTGPTIVTGNIALSPGSAVIGFPPGSVTGVIHIGDAPAVLAQANALTAYYTLAGQAVLPANNLTGQDLGGMTLSAGVYRFNTSAQLTGALTLNTGADPNAVFVFQIGSTLTTASVSSVTLTGAGALSDPNVFWQVGSSATLGTSTAFVGNILALSSITANTASTLANGRAIALTGAVTLDTNSASTPLLPPAAPGRFWNGSAGNLWSGASNWSTTAAGSDQVALGSNVDVVFSVNGPTPWPQNQNTILDFNATISSLTVNDPAAVTINGANTLTISSTGLVTGININSGAGFTNIGSNLVLGYLSQVVTVNNAAGMLISGVISGSNGLTKSGTGILTLTGIETYTGATVITGGTLQLGNGITPGTSIATSNSVLVAGSSTLAIDLNSGETFGNSVTDNGLIQWIAPGINTQASASEFSGSGSMLVTAPGTTVLLGSNSFNGGSTINTPGNVYAGTSSAYGSGTLTITNGYVDTYYNNQLLQINVGGYVQTGGTIGMHLEGTTPGSYTQYNVSGSANQLSGGTVYLYETSGNYVPQGAWVGNPSGDMQNIIHTAGTLSHSGFVNIFPTADFINPVFGPVRYQHGLTLLYPEVTFNDPADAFITWVQDPFSTLPGLTPNQTSVGGGLDYVQTHNPATPGGLITYLDTRDKTELPYLYDLIAPEELTAIFQIGFLGADIQNMNIERHLEQVREGASGYTSTGFTARSSDGKSVVVDGKNGSVLI